MNFLSGKISRPMAERCSMEILQHVLRNFPSARVLEDDLYSRNVQVPRKKSRRTRALNLRKVRPLDASVDVMDY